LLLSHFLAPQCENLLLGGLPDQEPHATSPANGDLGRHHIERWTARVASNNATNHTSGVAGRYAVALYAHAAELNRLQFVVPAMQKLGRMIKESADFRRLLESPLIDVREGTKAAMAVLKSHGFGSIPQHFVGVVAANRRLKSLPAIVAAFEALVAEKRGQIVAEVTTAYALSDEERALLSGRLAEAGYDSVNLVEIVDPQILGGLIVQIGSRLYDTSLKSRLQRLQHAMKGAA
jgi:F-type H+-transporting ATPase subunit delta